MKVRRLIALAILILVRTTAQGQTLTTGQISGTVTDPSGAVVPKAEVTVSDRNTGIRRTTESRSDGYYIVPLLDPGTYAVTIAAKGFETVSREGITVAVSHSALVDFRLQVGKTDIVMTISADAPLIEPSNPNTTTTFNATQLANIPNPGNDLTYVANLAPGAIMNTTTPSYPYNAGNVEFNGLPSLSNDFTIDGLDANNIYTAVNATGGSGMQLGLNAIQEATVSTATYSADQGEFSASQINYVTKSGADAFHGNAYEIWNGSALNANDFFLKATGQPKPRSNTNEFGASVGGPIKRGKLFFFTDFEGIRIVLPTVLTSTLPSPAYQSYVLQQLPLGGPDPVNGGTLPPQPAEVPLYKNMFSLMGDTSRGNPLAILGCPLNSNGSSAGGSPPDGNGCANTRIFSASPSASETLFTGKLDYDLDSKDRTWFRFQLNQGQNVQADPVNAIFNSVLKVPSRSGAAGWTHIFNSNLVNQFNPGISYLPGVRNLAEPTQALSLFPITYIVHPFTPIGNSVSSTPLGLDTTTWQLNDNVSWNRGRHAFKFGGDARRYLVTEVNGGNIYPAELGCSLAQFTFGATCSTQQSFSASVENRLRFVNLDAYATDTLRVSSKLTVTIGLRMSWKSNPVGNKSIFSRFDGAFQTISHDVNTPLNQSLMPEKSLVSGTPLFQWEPRAAIAYQLKPRTVFRAGGGIFGDAPFYSAAGFYASNPPTYNTFFAGLDNPLGGVAIAPGVPDSAVDVAVAANQRYLSGFAKGELSCASPQSNPTTCLPPPALIVPGGNGKFPAPYVYEWSASVEQQLGSNLGLTLRYLGTRFIHGAYYAEENGYQTVCAGCLAPLPFGAPLDPRFGTVEVLESGLVGSYNGLQITAQKRLSRGLSFQANYTYSHCLDEQSNYGGSSFNANSALIDVLPKGLRTYYGNCDYDIRNSLNGAYIYQLPFHAKAGWLQNIVGGWQVSGTVFVRGGLPVSIYSAYAFGAVTNTYGYLFADGVRGQSVYAKQPISGVTQPGTIQWLNPSAFQSVIDPGTGTCITVTVEDCQNGSLARNSVRGPGFAWTDFDIAKQFKIAEQVGFKLDVQFYNLFNHPNFGFPNGGFVAVGIPSEPGTLTNVGTISTTVSPSTGLVGGRLGGDSSVRMIALRGTITF